MVFRSYLANKCFYVLTIALAVGQLAGCHDESDGRLRVVFIADAGGLGDKGKNDLIWRGCQRLTEGECSVWADVDYRTPRSVAEGKGIIREAAGKADCVVVGAPVWEHEVTAVARRKPRVKFILVGGGEPAPNVKVLKFPARECGYLMGVAAAAAVPAGGFGFLGGREDGAARELAAGFAAGVRAGVPNATVETVFAGEDFEIASDTRRAEAEAEAMFGRGVTVIFTAAGPANAAIANVAKKNDKLIIGFQANQNALERGHVVTSLNVRWDEVVYEELLTVARGQFRGGLRELDIKSELISYPIDANNRGLLSPEAILKIETARQRLAAGECRI